jgi:hypothetical protein
MALFIVIEASRHQNGLASVIDICPQSANKGNR